MPGGMRPRVLLVGVLVVLAACSGDDAGADTTTPTTSTAATTTTTSTSTSTSTTSTSTTTTTSTTAAPTTTTTSVEDVKAQIAADLMAARQRLRELQFHPTLDGLEEKMATIAVPGSEYYEEEISFIKDLVRLGDVVRFGDPPVDSIVVEEVEFQGSEPLSAATVTICDAQNLARVTPPENSPVGEEIVAVEAQLLAVRYAVDVVRTEFGWVRNSATPRDLEAGFPGQSACDS